MKNYYSFFKPIEIFHLLGIIITLFFFIDLLYFFSLESNISGKHNVSAEKLEWLIYFLTYFIGILFFTLSFLNYNKIYLNCTYFFSFIFIIFFLRNFSFSSMDIILLIISLAILLIVKNFDRKKFLKFENLLQLLSFFILLKLSESFFYWMNIKNIFWKDILGNTNTSNKFSNFIESLSFYINLDEINYETLVKYFQFSYPVIASAFIVLILICLYFEKNNKYKISIKKYWWILPTIIFFLESFNTSGFFSKIGGGAMVHWQVYIGTLELMNNNGFLLWDTPSQYGFLSLISIYLMPFNDPWMKLYILNSLVKFFISILFFKLFWNKGNLFWYIIAFLLTWLLLHIISSGQSFANASSTPSSGPLRYIWVILICSILVSVKNFSLKNQIIILLPIWLIGCLWAVESAFYVSAAIAPYLFYILFFSNLSQTKRILFFLSFPATMLLSIIIICFYYIFFLGHLPDIISYIEYSISWYGGFTIENANYSGGVWIPILILSWIITEFFYCKDIKDKFIILSIWCGLWAVLSYTVSQTVDIVFPKQAYLYFFFFFLTHKIIGFNKENIFRFSPIFVILITFTFVNISFAKHFFNTINNQNYTLQNSKYEIIDEYNEILTLVNPGDISVTYIEPGRYKFYNSKNSYINKKNNQKINLNKNFWLPLRPAITMDPLPPKRRSLYINRWTKRHEHEKGWIIYAIDDHWQSDWRKIITDSLGEYNKVKQIEYGNLQAILYEKK